MQTLFGNSISIIANTKKKQIINKFRNQNNERSIIFDISLKRYLKMKLSCAVKNNTLCVHIYCKKKKKAALKE